MQPGSESKRTRQVASRYLSASAKQQQQDGWGDATTPRSRSSAGPWVSSASAHLPGGRSTYVNMDPPSTKSRSMGPPAGVSHHAGAVAKTLQAVTPRNTSSSMSRAGSNDITPQPDTARRHAAATYHHPQQQQQKQQPRPSGRSGEAFISPGSSRNSSRCTTPRGASAWAAPPSTPGALHSTSMAITPVSARATPAGQRLHASTGALGLAPPSSGKQRGPDPRRAALEEYLQQKRAAAQGGSTPAAPAAKAPAADGFRRPSTRPGAGGSTLGVARAPGQPAPRRQTMLLSPGPTSSKAAASDSSSHAPTAFTATAAALSQAQASGSKAGAGGAGPAAMDSAFTVTMAALKETGSGSKARRAVPRARQSPGSPTSRGLGRRPGSAGKGMGAGSPGGAGGSSSSKGAQRPATSGGLLQQVSPAPAAAAAGAAAGAPAGGTASAGSPPKQQQQQQQQQQQEAAESMATPTRGPATAAQQQALHALACQSALTPSRIPTLNLGGLTPPPAGRGGGAGAGAGGGSRLACATPPLTSRSVAAAAAVPLPDQGSGAWEAAQVPLPDATPRRHSMATAGLVTKAASGMLTPRQQQQQQQTPASSTRAQGALLTPRQRQQGQASTVSSRQTGTYARPSPGSVAAAAAAVLGRTPRGPRAGEAAGSPAVPRLPLTPRQAATSSTSSMAPPAAKAAAAAPSRAAPPPRAPGPSHSSSTTLVTPRGTSGWSYPVAGAASRPSTASSAAAGPAATSSTAPGRLLESRREAAEAAEAAAAEARLHASQLLLWRTLNCRLRAALASRRQQAQAQCAAVALAVCGLQARCSSLSLQLQQAAFRSQLAGACQQQLPALQGWAQHQGSYEERLAAVRGALRGALSRVPLVRGATAGAAGQPDAAALLALLQQGQEVLEGLEPALHLLLGKAAPAPSTSTSTSSAAAGPSDAAACGGEGLGMTAGMAGQLVGLVREECGVLAEVQALLGRVSEASLYANSLAVQAEALRGMSQGAGGAGEGC